MTGKDLRHNHLFTKWENAVVVVVSITACLMDNLLIFENNLPMNL